MNRRERVQSTLHMGQSLTNKNANSSSASQEILHFMEPCPEPDPVYTLPSCLRSTLINVGQSLYIYIYGFTGTSLMQIV